MAYAFHYRQELITRLIQGDLPPKSFVHKIGIRQNQWNTNSRKGQHNTQRLFRSSSFFNRDMIGRIKGRK